MRIELESIGKRFGDLRALVGVSSSLADGARVALIGPNGSGKSTLIRALLGLVSHEGEVRIDGRRSEPQALAARLAYVPQVAPQAAAPVGDFVRAIAALRGIEPAAVIDSAARMELDLRALLPRPLRNLSGGSKQKLLLAIAFACPAELLVLDEPTASLDARARGAFFTRCAELPAATTLLLCSHRLEEIHHLVDHVLALEDGRAIYDGPAADFLAERSVSVVSCLIEPGADDAWLRAQGFAPGAPGWWARTVQRRDKLALLVSTVGALAGRLRDLQVRELDTLEMKP